MKIYVALFALIATPFSWGAPTITSTKPDDVEVVIYRLHPVQTSSLYEKSDAVDGIALVTETREVDLPVGSSTIVFKRIAESIVPQTAKLLELPGDLIESNFDYNLISPATLIESSIGKTVRVIRNDKHSGRNVEDTAIIRSGPDGVVLDLGDRIEALGCSGLNETIIFNEVPESLIADPSLSAKINVKRAGRYRLRLSYLATGLDWSADYVAQLQPDGHSMDLLGWITLSNHLSTSFPNASVKVVAGNLTIDEKTSSRSKSTTPMIRGRCWPLNTSFAVTYIMASTAIRTVAMPPPPEIRSRLEEIIVTAQKQEATLSELGDYKLYSLPERTTLAANQTKQVLFLNKRNVNFERVYRFALEPGDSSINNGDNVTNGAITLKVENKLQKGLGIPLPMGTIATFDIDAAGNAIFAGDQWVRDVAINSKTEVITGEALDVSASTRIVNKRDIQRWWSAYQETELEVRVSNAKTVPARIEIEFNQESYPEHKVSSESKPHKSRSGKLIWTYDLSPSQEEVLHVALKKPL